MSTPYGPTRLLKAVAKAAREAEQEADPLGEYAWFSVGTEGEAAAENTRLRTLPCTEGETRVDKNPNWLTEEGVYVSNANMIGYIDNMSTGHLCSAAARLRRHAEKPSCTRSHRERIMTKVSELETEARRRSE